MGPKARSSGCPFRWTTPPSVGRVRAVKSPSFTAAFFAKEAVRKRRPKHSIRMDGGPAQPSPTIGQCLNGGLEVECNRCKTKASLPLDAIRRPRDTPLWKLEASLKCRSCRKGPVRAAGAHDQVD